MRPNKILYKILGALLLTFCVSFGIEVFRTLYLSLSYRGSSFAPWTLAWVWEIGAFIFVFFIFNRQQVDYGSTLTFSFIALILAPLLWGFYPASYKTVNPNYYGIETQTNFDVHEEEGRYGEEIVYDHKLYPRYLYRANDPQLQLDLKIETYNNEYVGTQGFIFWQTGFAYGFIPDLIDEYNGGDTFLHHLENYVSVGPLVLLECIFIGIYRNFITIVLLQIIWFLWKRDFVWW